jgi:hypothetical protein
MLNYKKINDIIGWVIFSIATLVYILTVEPTASFWDCGEFIAASYKLEVPHPPGAPLFLLIGRIFSMFAIDKAHVAFCINLVSVFSSGFTILFLFWTITLLAKKLVVKAGEEITKGQIFTIMGSGIIGALAYTFSDSFWFSAVEAEVYAISSFFTAFVFWAILKWETISEREDADKWLILIAYVMGLSVGAHLLNLVTIPALAFVYFYKRFKYTHLGAGITFVASLFVVLFILEGIIPGLPSLAGSFEIKFVNSFNLPVGSGIAVFAVLFLGGLIWGIRYSIQKNKRMINTSLVALAFILIGYASYGIIVIRSQFNTPMDENNPENVISFVSYLKREQYGDRPLFYGPQYTARLIAQEKGAALYRFDDKTRKYIVYDYKMKNTFDQKNQSLIPRIWSRQPEHIRAYTRKIKGFRAGEKPTFGQNLSFMFEHQFGQQYFRYFGWNFIGREHDIQGAGVLFPNSNNNDLPESVKNNWARNQFWMLPLLLGVIGLVWHYGKDAKSFIVVTLLFLLTGLALSFYLNQPPIEPRERDYIFAGSFYAFAIWIGFGVLALSEWLQTYIKSDNLRPILVTSVALVVPGIMLAEGWNDHNRSNRFHSVDSAKNLLNSCAPNAILFTGGDNDTFPLWYVQEVEGFRTDVRVCNLSLLNTDWYIKQMTMQAYESDPLPITIPFEMYVQGNNDFIYPKNFEGLITNLDLNSVKNGVDLNDYIDLVASNNSLIKAGYGDSEVTFCPTDTFTLKINKAAVLKSGIIPKGLEANALDVLKWGIDSNGLEKKDLIILDMIAHNNWKRPIYFSTTLSRKDFLNLKPYMQMEGLAYRLLPMINPRGEEGRVQSDIMYKNMMTKYFWRGLDDENVYYDENYRRFPMNVRESFGRLAEQLFAEGKNEEAKKVILTCLAKIPNKTIPYDYSMAQFIGLLLKLKDEKSADNLATILASRIEDEIRYMSKNSALASPEELRYYVYVLGYIADAYRMENKKAQYEKYSKIYQRYSGEAQ